MSDKQHEWSIRDGDRRDWMIWVSDVFQRIKMEDDHGKEFEMDLYTFEILASWVLERNKR